MRVIIVSGIYPPDIGGPATHSADLTTALEQRGHGVRVVTLSDERNRNQPGSSVVTFPRSWPWPLRLLAVTKWLISERRSFDVVYATGLHPAAVAGARLARRPCVVKVVGDPAWERAVRRGLTHEDFESFQQPGSSSISITAMRRLRDWSVAASDAVIVPSAYLGDVVSRWVPEASIGVIHNGVLAPARLPAQSGAADQLRLVYVGRLVAHKRVDVLVRAVAAVDGVRLDIVGEGPEDERILTLIQDLDVSKRVHALGVLPHDQVLPRLAGADALVLASEYEGLPHAVLEALAAGVPVIAPPVGGVEEVVVHESNGLLVRQSTVEGFISSIRRYKDDGVLRDSLQEHARAESHRWSFDRTVDRIESLFHELLDERPRAVLVGKVHLDQTLSDDVVRKFDLLSHALSVTFVGTGGGPRRDTVSGVKVIRCPELKPPFLGGVLFYLTAPLVALLAARSHNAAVVCQSPFEGFGVVALSRCLPPSRRPRIVIEAHGDWRTAARLYGSAARKAVAPVTDVVARWTVRRADRVRVVAKYLETLVRETGYAGQIDRFVTYSDFSLFSEAQPRVLPKVPTLCFIGAFEPYKAVDVLVDAWRQVSGILPEARLMLAGDGPLREEIAGRVRDLGLETTVEFTGALSRPQVRDLLDKSWGLVLPSRSEGLPRVIFEAMLRSRAVVAAKVGDIPEVVQDGHNGYLVDPDDFVGLADSIVTFLSDQERTMKMGAEGRRQVLSRDLMSEYRAGVNRLAVWLRNP